MTRQLPTIGWSLWGLAVGLAFAVDWAKAGTTIDPAYPYAYGANVGWMDIGGDVSHGAVIGASYCTGYVWSANCGWICLGNGPTNGWQYGNMASDDFGVNHDGEGNLSGQAFGANIGWLSFEQTHGHPRIDLRTGIMSGYAYGANVGWICFSNAQAYVRTERFDTGPDSDSDQLPDVYEYRHTNTLAALSGLSDADADGDGATDAQEYGADTDPFDNADCLRLVSIEVAGSTHRLVWSARPTRLYRLEMTNSLIGADAWQEAVQGPLGPPTASTMTQAVLGVTATTRFYRVKAVLPLSE